MKEILKAQKHVKMSSVDLVAGAIVIVLSLFIILYAIPYQVSMAFGSKGVITPRTLPYGVAVVMLLCGAKMMWDGFALWRRQKKGGEAQTVNFSVIAFLVALIGFFFAVGITKIGYVPVNLISMFLLYFICGGRKPWVAAVMAVAFTIVSVLFFRYYLQIPVPLFPGMM